MGASTEFFYFSDLIEVLWIWCTLPEDAEVIPIRIIVHFQQPIEVG